MKRFFPSLMLLFVLPLFNSIKAQNLTDYDKKLDLLLYENNSYIIDFSRCLTSVYHTVIQAKRISNKGQGNCDHETPWDISHMKDSLFYKAVQRTNPELFEAFNSLNEVCKQVVIDLKLERLDEEKLSAHIARFEKSCIALNRRSEPFRSRLKNNALAQMPRELSAYLNAEYDRFKDLRHHLRINLAVNFPEALLRKDLQLSDSLMVLLELKASNDRSVRMCMYAFEGFQNSKKYHLNELDYKKRRDAGFYNNFYYQIHNHYNNGIISILRTYYRVPYSLYIPYLPFNNTADEPAPIAAYHYKGLNSEVYTGAIAHWNVKDADALGILTEALNRATIQTNQTTRELYKLKVQIEAKISGKSKFVSMYHKFSLNAGDIEAALGRLKLNKNEAFPIITIQAKNILQLLEDTRTLYESIQLDIENKGPKDIDYSETEKLLQQYRGLVDELEKQLQILHQNINKANAPKLNGQDNWSKTSRALMGYCEELHTEIQMAEKRSFEADIKDDYDYSRIEKAYADLLEREIPMMAGIKKFGPGNGKCPYGIFEDVLEKGLAQHRSVMRFSDSTQVPFLKGCCDGYWNMVRAYNDAVEYYNKFSLQGAERDTDFAKYDHPTAVINPLLLAKAVGLPDMKLQAVPPPPPIPVPEPTPTPIEEPKVDSAAVPRSIRKAEEMNKAFIERCKPNNVIFLIDISASMNEEKKLQHFKDDLSSIALLMRPDDMISIVSFEGKSELALKQTTVTNQKKWEKAIEKLQGTGGTQFNQGLATAYDYMQKIANPDFNNRIVLVSDGAFRISDESVAMVQRLQQTRGIVFSALVYHPHAKVFNEILDLTAIGKGNYSMVTARESGALVLFSEFSVLKAE